MKTNTIEIKKTNNNVMTAIFLTSLVGFVSGAFWVASLFVTF